MPPSPQTLGLTSFSTRALPLHHLERNGDRSQHAVCIYPAVDAVENETDLAIEEEKEWMENRARSKADSRRWSEGQPAARSNGPPGNKRRRFNSNDGDKDDGLRQETDKSKYNYYNKETICVPPSEFNRLVLVQNVAGNVTTSELRQIFGNIGTIEKIYLPAESDSIDGTKRAEVLYEAPKHARTAVKALNHLSLCQQSLKLKLASSDAPNDGSLLPKATLQGAPASSRMRQQHEAAIDSLLEIRR